MTDDLIAHIQSFTLNARALLEVEAGRQIEGIYGWLPDGKFASIKGYPAIAQLEEARETRRRLEQFAADEQAAGFVAREARRKLIRETAFTWLNRFVAFRLMEERKLIKQTIVKLQKSNQFIFWIVEDANAADRTEFDKGGLPLNAMGEGPSDIAYRHFLLWECGELARDVSVLFDPTTVASRLCPRPPGLKQLIEDMNAETLSDAWKAGNEETIGWVYQSFSSEELQAAFAAARQSKKKFEAPDIPAVTQLFTIRWVVRFLVENTLGRLWVQMHPDSRLKNQLGYLVPVEKTDRPLKLAQEISFLDPCCGSMHFGLVAFDIYVEMYREEMENAGRPGWLARASVANSDEIPSSIIRHNIYGLDLDLRAVQLSALTLFLRARTLNPKCTFTDQNLCCANVEEITGGRLDEFIKQAKFSHPIYERILRALAERLKDSNNLGSLLRLDRDLEQLVAEERKKVDAGKQFTLAFRGLNAEQFRTQAGIEEFFGILTDQVLQHLDTFVQASRTQGQDSGHFVSETAKGLRFMRIIQHRFDVVATNPPYLSGRKMNDRLAKLMDDNYADGKGDLYAAFIVRCQELLKDDGLMGMLTMHSFMFITTYEDLRTKLRSEVAIEALVHFGGGLFAVGNPGTLQTAAFVLGNEKDKQSRDEHRGVYFRLVNEPDAQTKCRAFEAALAAHCVGQTHQLLFRCVQKDFDDIPGEPWVYFITPTFRRLFHDYISLEKIAVPRQGAKTTDNFRFLRLWWEVGQSRILRDCDSHEAAVSSQLRWVPYAKGGTMVRWYGNYYSVVNWNKGGLELKEVINQKRKKYSPGAKGDLWGAWLNSYDYYFKKGVAYSYLSSKSFSARVLPPGYIFDVAASTIFTSKFGLTIAVLNSRIGEFLLYLLNPTVNSQIGDLCRLPMPSETTNGLEVLVTKAIELTGQIYNRSEKALGFTRPFRDFDEPRRLHEKILESESLINVEVSALYRLNEEDMAAVERELSSTSLEESDGNSTGDRDEAEETPEEVTAESSAQSWISYAFGTALGRFEIGTPSGLGCGDFSGDMAAAIRKLIDSDGIMTSDSNHPQDIVERILDCLELMLGPHKVHAIIRTAAGAEGDSEDNLRDWINGHFWKYHYLLYRKRPIYWPLQSPSKKFTVWVFHERLSEDSLFKVRSDFVEPKVRWLEARIKELKAKVLSSNGRERRTAEKEASQQADILDDVQEFAQRLNRIAQSGYTPHIDDGVLLNAAPLWALLPAWPDAKKAWQELEAGEYDWTQQAMESWPGRVKEKCKANKSFAIAHGLA